MSSLIAAMITISAGVWAYTFERVIVGHPVMVGVLLGDLLLGICGRDRAIAEALDVLIEQGPNRFWLGPAKGPACYCCSICCLLAPVS